MIAVGEDFYIGPIHGLIKPLIARGARNIRIVTPFEGSQVVEFIDRLIVGTNHACK